MSEFKIKVTQENVSYFIYYFQAQEIIGENNYKKIHNAASVIKVLIMCAMMNKLIEDDKQVDEIIYLKKGFKQLAKRESDIFYNKNIDYKVSINELLSWMIKISENTCTDVLIDYLGFDYINDYANKVGMKNTRLNRYMTDSTTCIDTYVNEKENFTTLEDTFLIFSKIFKKEILNENMCNYAKQILFDQRLNAKLPRFIFENIQFAHKTGGLSIGISVCNDAGVFVINDKLYFTGIFIENHDFTNANLICIGEIGKEIYIFLKSLSKQTINTKKERKQ